MPWGLCSDKERVLVARGLLVQVRRVGIVCLRSAI